MIKNYLILPFYLITVLFLFSCESEKEVNSNHVKNPLTAGYWSSNFTIQGYRVPFVIFVDENQNLTIDNNGEIVKMEKPVVEGDSIIVYFTNYPTFLKFKIDENQKFSGYFSNPDDTNIQSLKLTGEFVGTEKPNLLKVEENTVNLAGNWEVYFRPNTPTEYPAIGKFTQEGNIVSGTFLKKSGDSRFLKGNVLNQNEFYLYGFGGSHATLYKAKYENDTLKGSYFPSNKTEIKWYGVRNDDFQLPNMDSLTYLVDDKLELNVKTIDGEDFYFPNKDFEGKVTIIQILGTWCPNCLDEARFFKELYNDFHEEGLEILGVAYENPKEFDEQARRVRRYTQNEEIPYKVVIGGDIQSKKVKEDFNMLNDVTAFPTSIFLNKQGEVVKIQTGFNGPGTGEIYENYRTETIKLIRELLD